MRLSDGVEWGVHVCVLLATLPDDAALPAAKLAEYHDVPAAYLAKHLQALAGAGVLDTQHDWPAAAAALVNLPIKEAPVAPAQAAPA